MIKLPEELQYIQNSLKKQKTTDARMDGKVCVVTGATSGVGYQAARRLAEGGAQLVMVCRNREKASQVQDGLVNDFGCRTEIIIADFRKLSDVSHAASTISKMHPEIHVLVNNAGVFNKSRHLTPDGNEEIFGVIHLASFLFTKMLLENLKNGAPSRIIDINSEAHRFGGLNPDDLNWSKRPYIALRAYGAAKIAQILTSQELAKRLNGSGVTVNVIHPGAVRTNIGMNNNIFYRFYSRYILSWFLKDPVISGDAIYYLAAAPELQSVSGKYFNRTIEEKPANYVIKDDLRMKIWERSEALVQPFLEAP
jgi:NAD(P)-dependent dehydrogenase (short-subunit alcohol dehydrogenase family)